MKRFTWEFCLLAMVLSSGIVSAQAVQAPPVNGAVQEQAVADEKAKPIFKDGLAQIVPEFNDPAQWIKHDLFVETEFDSDDDGRPDRMHVSVVRQKQTDTEGLKVPAVYNTSPYFCGTGTTAPGTCLLYTSPSPRDS